MSYEVKPCPFCGGNAYELEREQTSNGLHGIICGGCDVRVFSTKNEARAKWNRRQPKAKALVELDTFPVVACMSSAFAHLMNQPGTSDLYQAAHDILQYVETTIPPDQSERIKKLEADLAALVAALESAQWGSLSSSSSWMNCPECGNHPSYKKHKLDCSIGQLITRIRGESV